MRVLRVCAIALRQAFDIASVQYVVGLASEFPQLSSQSLLGQEKELRAKEEAEER